MQRGNGECGTKRSIIALYSMAAFIKWEVVISYFIAFLCCSKVAKSFLWSWIFDLMRFKLSDDWSVLQTAKRGCCVHFFCDASDNFGLQCERHVLTAEAWECGRVTQWARAESWRRFDTWQEQAMRERSDTCWSEVTWGQVNTLEWCLVRLLTRHGPRMCYFIGSLDHSFYSAASLRHGQLKLSSWR